MGLVKRFAMQMLNSLQLLQKHRLIHCDLKPENILLKHPTKSTIKVIDFGSSCLENEKGNKEMERKNLNLTFLLF